MKLPLSIAFSLLALPVAMAQEEDAEFKITANLYMPDSDHLKICQGYFGAGAVVADFADFKAMDSDTVQETMSELNIGATHNEKYYFVTYNGQSLYPGTMRHAYFFENNGGDPPAFFDAVDRHGGLNVGVTNKLGQVICKIAPTAGERMLFEVQSLGHRLLQTINDVGDGYSVRRRLSHTTRSSS